MRAKRVHRVALVLFACVLVSLAGCRFPDDPEGSLENVEGGTLRVGYVDDPPWAYRDESGDVRGVEAELMRQFAARHDAEVTFTEGTESELAAALAGFQLDVVIGGLTTQTAYATEVAMTRPYVDTEFEIATPPGSELPDELGGVEIYVEENSEAAARLRQEEQDAIPVPFEALNELDGPALIESWQRDAIGFDSTNYILADDEHAVAVPMGENALITELEYFLLDHEAQAEKLLAEESERLAAEPMPDERAGGAERDGRP